MTAAGRVLPRDQYDRNRARVMQIAALFKMDRQDRLEVAEVLFDRNVSSYNDLSHIEMGRLRDGFECAALICNIQMERAAGKRR